MWQPGFHGYRAPKPPYLDWVQIRKRAMLCITLWLGGGYLLFLFRSNIGVVRLNVSVLNGCYWDPSIITTWLLGGVVIFWQLFKGTGTEEGRFIRHLPSGPIHARPVPARRPARQKTGECAIHENHAADIMSPSYLIHRKGLARKLPIWCELSTGIWRMYGLKWTNRIRLGFRNLITSIPCARRRRRCTCTSRGPTSIRSPILCRDALRAFPFMWHLFWTQKSCLLKGGNCCSKCMDLLRPGVSESRLLSRVDGFPVHE